MKILLATDSSEFSEAAVDEIASRPFPAGSEVRVVSIVTPPYYPTIESWSSGVDTRLYAEQAKSSHEESHAAVEKAAAKLRAGNESRELKISTVILSGSPKEAIIDASESFGADLIVVGSHGQGMLERFLLGSVSQAVALHAKCSVEIVRLPKTLSA